MADTTKIVQFIDNSGGVQTPLYPKSEAEFISVERLNEKIPEDVETMQDVIDALGSLAFMDEYEDPTTPTNPPDPVTNLVAVGGNQCVKLTWDDPEDNISDSGVWASTVIVRKTGSYPSSVSDGTIVTTSYLKDQYKITPYTDSGLVNGITYYYRAFTCSVDDIYNESDIVQASAKPRTFKTMTVVIDLTDSNPETCGSYADDAVGMESGRDVEEWKEFFGYRPCLLKDGVVNGYLKDTNYAQYESGGSADITSGNSGDVMIEFPRRGVKIVTAGNTLTISMTEDPDNSEFTYYAHTRGTARKENFYVGAYLCGDTMTSISGVRIRSSRTFQEIKEELGSTRPSGYQLMTFYQWTYLQVMYLLQFRGNFNVEKTNGIGGCLYNVSGGYLGTEVTGNYDKYGLFYGLFTQAYRSKLFGIEDLYGTEEQLLDGIIKSDVKPSVYLGTDNFSTDGQPNLSYSEYSNTMPEYMNGFITETFASSELGFIPKTANPGSGTTYYCDYVSSFDGYTVYTVGYIRSAYPDGYSGMFAVQIRLSTAVSCIARISYY